MSLESLNESLISYSRNESPFFTVQHIRSQYFPQCVKYLFPTLLKYWLVSRVGATEHHWYHLKEQRVAVKEGFVCCRASFVRFHLDRVADSTPDDLEVFVEHGTGDLSAKDKALLLAVLKDRWYKGDLGRLEAMLRLECYDRLTAFVENCLWERGYEDNYTLGQQLSIRMTTNLIQSGLDFKHHVSDEKKAGGRGWSDPCFEKMLCCIRSVADVTKRYKWSQVYVMLELDRNNLARLQHTLSANFSVVTNGLLDNVCLINCTKDKSSAATLNLLAPLIASHHLNVVFVTDTENHLSNALFYTYNSMKFYYYCLKNRFVFSYEDYETMYLLFTIVAIELANGGCLNSFTLEKSPLMHPLELNSRRCNALKRAAAQNKMVCNDMELKVDFVRGKRITTGTHDPSRLVEIEV